jgi:hypothetical protein
MSRDDTIKLTIKSLLEVVQTGAKNIEISVMESYGKVTVSVMQDLSLFTQLIVNRISTFPKLSTSCKTSNVKRSRVSDRIFSFLSLLNMFRRGGEEANKIGSNCGRTGSYGGWARWIYWGRGSSSRRWFGCSVVAVKMQSYLRIFTSFSIEV